MLIFLGEKNSYNGAEIGLSLLNINGAFFSTGMDDYLSVQGISFFCLWDQTSI